MTYPYDNLDEELRQLTNKMLPGQPVPSEMKCSILLATAGVKPEWNSTKLSKGHRNIALNARMAVLLFVSEKIFIIDKIQKIEFWTTIDFCSEE